MIYQSLDEFMILVIKVVGVTEMNKVDFRVWEKNKRSCFSLFKRVESYVTVKGVKCLNPTRGSLLFGYSAPTFMMEFTS